MLVILTKRVIIFTKRVIIFWFLRAKSKKMAEKVSKNDYMWQFFYHFKPIESFVSLYRELDRRHIKEYRAIRLDGLFYFQNSQRAQYDPSRTQGRTGKR